MKYFVREELDKPIKGIYDDIGLAISGMGANDQIYNQEGELVIAREDMNIMTNDHIYTFSTTDYNKAWDELKTYYENELHIIKMSEVEGYIGTKMAELFYSSVVKKIKEIEAKHTKVIGGN